MRTSRGALVLILSGAAPRQQENRGGLQDVDHTQMLRGITRYARTIREPSLALSELDEAIARAFGEIGEPGPVFLDFPTDTLRAEIPKALQMAEHIDAKLHSEILPDPKAVVRAVDVLWSARRVLVISGRGAKGAGPALDRPFKNRPALVDVVVTPEAISSDGKSGLAGVPDLQPLAAWDEAERKWREGSR